MTNPKKSVKRTAGLTLMELLVAMALLMSLIIPIMGVFVMGSRTSSLSYDLTIASVTSQLRMEELVGMTRAELFAKFGQVDTPGAPPLESTRDDNGMRVDTRVVFDNFDYAELAEATVTVYSRDGSFVLCTQTDVINIAEGGGFS